MLGSFIQKIRTARRMARAYENWPSLMAYRLNIRPQPMIVKCRDGSMFKVRDRRRHVSDAYVINESYLYGIHDLILPYLARAKVCIDVGAYIGSFSVYAAKRSSATIFALEPIPETAELLKENIKLNKLQDRVILIEAALLGKKITGGTVDLYIPTDAAFGSVSKSHLGLYEVNEEPKILRVPSITISEIFERHQIDFCDVIKMDCEGAEYDILYNTPREIFERIGVMTIECHKDGNVGELTRFLEERNFEVVRPSTEFAEIFCKNKAAGR